MKELFNVFGDLANKAKSGGLGTLIGDMTGQNQAQEPSRTNPQAASSDAGGGFGLGGMLGSAALGSVIGALLTSKKTRDVAGSLGKGALVVGSGAAVAALAWKLYQGWSQKAGSGETSPTQAPQSPQYAQSASYAQTAPSQANALPGGAADAERQGALIMRAVIYAARSDGHVDATEQAHIERLVESMGSSSELARQVEAMMREPVDPRTLVSLIRSPAEAEDVYRLSVAIAGGEQFMERAYLDALAGALGFGADARARLEREGHELAAGQGA